MYGIGNTYELLNQQEMPQLMQGLLGSTGEQNRVLDAVISNGMNKAAQLGQFAQLVNPAAGNDLLNQRQISTQQSAQQAMAQQAQRDAQNGSLLMKIAKMFLV